MTEQAKHEHLSEFGQRIMEAGCPWMGEKMIRLGHMEITVPHEYVAAVKQLAYECVPVLHRVDVVGSDVEPWKVAREGE